MEYTGRKSNECIGTTFVVAASAAYWGDKSPTTNESCTEPISDPYNQGDVAVLFDANGLEVDRCIYPHRRIRGSAVQHRKQLVRDSGTWWMVDEL